MKKLIVDIPLQVKNQLKLEAIAQGITLRQLVIAYLEADDGSN